MDATYQETKKRRGRRAATATFRLTDYERRALDGMVVREGYVSLSDLLRAIIRDAIKKASEGNKSN